MVGKTFRKKQVVSQHERQEEGASIDLCQLLGLLEHTDELEQHALMDTLPTDFKTFLQNLVAEKSSSGQIRVLQAQKRKMRTLLTSMTSPLTAAQLKIIMSILLKLYLYPCYFAFQTTLEWLTSCFHEIDEQQKKNSTDTDAVSVVNIIASTSAEILDSVIIKEWKLYQQTLDNNNTVDCNIILQWLPAFNALALLDREFQWMSVQDMSPLKNYATLLFEMFQLSCKQLGCDTSSSTSSLSVPQLIKWGSICTECSRNLVAVLKSRRSVNSLLTTTWFIDLLKVTLTSSWQLLASEHVPTKDAYTSAGAAFVLSFAVLLQQFDSANVESGLADLIRVVCCQQTSSQDSYALGKLSSFAASPSLIPVKLLKDFPCTSRCSLLRGLMHTTEIVTLLAPDTRSLYFDEILDTVSYLCLHGNSTDQLYAMQSLEVWICRLHDLLRRNLLTAELIEQIRVSFVRSRLSLITKVLCTSWAHPARQVSHIVPAIYETLIKTLMILHPHSNGNNTSASSIWSEILLEASRMPSFHRGKYQAMKILMESIGVDFFLSLQPNIVSELVNAMKDRDISASVATLIVAIVKSMLSLANKRVEPKEATSSVSVVSVWEKQVICALSSVDKTWRNNVADYLFPELCKLEVDSCAKLLSNLDTKMFLSRESGDLWCIVQILYNAKQLGQNIVIPGADAETATQQRNKLIEQALATAAINVDDHLRLAALITLTTSLKMTIPVTTEDWTLFQQVLPHSLKTSDADQCSKVSRAVKNIVLRSKLNANKSAEGYQFLDEMLTWFVQEVIKKNLYPGVTFDREYSVLSLLHTVYSTLVSEEGGATGADKKKDSANNGVNVMTLLTSKLDVTLVDNLLNCFLSTWDKSRRISAELMIRLLPHPWPGYGDHANIVEGLKQVHKIINWAKGLAESARLRESDAGAQMLSSVFTVYCIDLGWKLFSTTADVSGNSVDKTEAVGSSCEEFVTFILTSLENSLQQLEKIFGAITSQNFQMSEFLASDDLEGDFALGHGLLLSLKLCLLSLDKAGLFKQSTAVARWTVVIKKIESIARKSLDVAMTVVAEAKSDVPFAPAPTSSTASVLNKDQQGENTNSSTVTCKGPINSATGLTMAASYVNTNSFMAAVATDDNTNSGNNEEDGLSAKAQRAIVAAWLLVKESTALLATLVEVTPIPTTAVTATIAISADEVVEETISMLNTKEIENIGNLLLDALGRLKHMGAIAEAHVALQAVTTVLLRYGDRNSYLSHLPSIWLSSLINRLRNHQQVFILRRSAGFAYSFLSLLRSEPANCTPTLLHDAMKALLAVVAKGIANGTADTPTHDGEEEDWKLSVHALNVLRLIILDGAFGNDLDQYIPQALTMAFIGFQSPHWAVRNSAMMVFSATVQRSVSKEKNDTGGSTAVTAQDFFHRYSSSNSGTTASMSLFNFLLQRLDRITQPYLEGKYSGDLDDSLYPLLLLFAKFRATMFPTNSDESNVDTSTADTGKLFDLTLFLPLFTRCANSKVAYVRTMAGRAFSSLIPITETPNMLHQLLAKLVIDLESACEKEGQMLGANEIHGRLLQLFEVLQQVVKHKHQSIDSTHSFFITIEESLLLQENGSPSDFVILFHKLMNQLSPLSSTDSQNMKAWNFTTCPSIHLVLFQILKALNTLSSKVINQELTQYLILVESRTIVSFYLLKQTTQRVDGSSGARMLTLQVDPYAPWTVREALKELVQHDLSLFAQTQIDETTMKAVRQELDTFLGYLSHPVSEVREGIAQGILQFLTTIKSVEQYQTVSTKQSLSFYFLQVLPNVITALDKETEPVLIEVFLGILNK